MTGGSNRSISSFTTDDQELWVEQRDHVGDCQAQFSARAIKHLDRRPIASGGKCDELVAASRPAPCALQLGAALRPHPRAPRGSQIGARSHLGPPGSTIMCPNSPLPPLAPL